MIDLKISKKIFNSAYFSYLYNYSNPLEIYYGGSGSGKSVFIMQKLLIKAFAEKRKILVMRKVQSSQKESCWRLCLDILKQWGIYDYTNIRVSDMTIELPNDSVILFKGLDDPEKIKSIVEPTDIWMEEATEFTEDDFLQLTLRNRAKSDNLQIFLSFNPVSKANWVYKRWFDEDSTEKAFILKTTYKDNKFLTKQYIEKLEDLIQTNPTYHKIYALGDFVSLEKLIYNNWKIKEFDHSILEGKLLVGLDFGFVNDPSALVASILDEQNKKIYIFKEWGDTGKTNSQISEIIKNLGFSKSVIIADSAEQKSIAELKRSGIIRIKGASKGRDSIIFGIQKLQQYEIIVHPSCDQTITELENYSWKKDKKNNEYINEPIDKFNHFLDALRYSLQCVENNKKLGTFNKNLLGI